MDLSPDEEHFQGRLLHQAALWDNLELLQELLSTGAEVDALDDHHRSALHAAALAERSRCLGALCAAGADVDAQSDEATGGKTALHISAERGHVENINRLVGAGAALSRRDAARCTPRELAERAGHRHAATALRNAEDALERERLSQHAILRELVARADAAQLKSRLAALGSTAGLIVNMTPAGANTLLYLASESGHCGVVSLLVGAGADGRAHPVTRYGPLYAAARHNHVPVAKLLLAHFPQAVQQESVEKWMPLHAACLGGHAALVTLLLEYPYPEALLNTYTDSRGEWQYTAAFDVNARDVTGQTPLYVACALGHVQCVNALLEHTVPCVPTDDTQQCSEPPPLRPAAALSPLRSGISLGIHAIVSKLTGNNRSSQESSTRRLRPVRLEIVRNGLPPSAPNDTTPSNVETSRDTRRRSRSASAVSHASENRHCASPSPCRANYDSDDEGPWTALAIACRMRHVHCAAALLAHGATDATCRALQQCMRNDLPDLAARILATKAYPDPDHKLNKSTVTESVFTSRPSDPALTYSGVCPTTPVMLNWRELRSHIPYLRMSWVRLAALHVNCKLSSSASALLAVTRIDVACNDLRLLPPDLFSMPSLKYLNAAQNKLSRLPSPSDPPEAGGEEAAGGGWRGRGRGGRGARPALYTAPALAELYLQDNRLEELPPGLFSLPALTTLDVSNNKLRALPNAMWCAPALRDLNAAFNHLRDLPTGEENSSECKSPVASSPVEQRSASAAALLPNTSLSKSSSRSPSMESSESELLEDGEPIPLLGNRAGNAVWCEAGRAHPWRGAVESPPPPPPPPAAGAPARGLSPLHALNLAHNQFSCIPPALACRATSLARLNMSYNSLRSMSYVTSYPSSLRQLDLSHNEITCWPSLPQLERFGSESPLACYCPDRGAARPRSGGGVRSQLMSAACAARRHLRLEGTRTLILSNNLLTRIQLTTDDDGYASDLVPDDNDDDDEWGGGGGSEVKGRLLFPLLSMLDVSCNLLRSIPPALRRLTNLAVLNISNNKDITTLPPQMGLLSRLWSLNAMGCNLSEPLRSMVANGKYKSADVVGYLKSVLHSATKYTRMRLMLVGQQGIGKTSLLECLRQESAIQHRRKPTDHWAARMGNKSSRRNMSTVGVDIGAWTYDKQRSTRGPVTFRTWDFGGQQEYYATHQYFLSRRCLYLVLWKVTDGRKGLLSAFTWLRSIQARAPGSPVIMVGTYYDQVCSSALPDSESPEALQRLIRSNIMGAPDADKLGLPRVMDSLEVSCSTRHNIRLLADIIYSVAFSIKPPGSKEPLLEQLIPASYLALEECVTSLAADLTEPVLNHTDYKRLVTQYMQQKNLKMFRDAAELHQATMFLHENGVVLHYDDATLKELYFVRPQWLCDVLAHVVTVREINPFATNGIMKMEDLAHVFKASPQLARLEEASSLGVALLHKFELALCWDARTLLIPPLLPATEPAAPQLPVRGRAWSSGSRGQRRPWPALNPHLAQMPDSNRHTDSPALVQEGMSSEGITVSGRNGSPLTRLLLLTYVPCGFWTRLCSRLLADAALARAPHHLYRTNEMESDDAISRALQMDWGWKVWRQGARLVCGELTLVCVREIPPSHEPLLPAPGEGGAAHPYENIKLRVKQDGLWCELDVQSSACIEIQLPAQSCLVRRDDAMPIARYQVLTATNVYSQDGLWCELDVQSSACIEIQLPAQSCLVRRDDAMPIARYQVLTATNVYSQDGLWCELDVQSSACIEIQLPAQSCLVRRDDAMPIARYQVLTATNVYSQDGLWCELDVQSSACIEIQLPAQSCLVRRDDAMPIARYQVLTATNVYSQDGLWCELDVQSSACIEIQLPAQSCLVRRDDAMPIARYQSISLEPSPATLAKVLAIVSDHVDLLLEDWYPSLAWSRARRRWPRCWPSCLTTWTCCWRTGIHRWVSISLEPSPATLAKVLAIVSDHVDLLLEDWYPSLGTRFVHTSEGRCLITRVVPCPGCLKDLLPRSRDPDLLAQQAFRRLELGAEPRPRVSQDSRTSDGDSGVGAESNASSRIGSVEGIPHGPQLGLCWAWAWGWTVEQCIHCACAQLPLNCPLHPDVALHHVAPDTLLLDVPEEYRARWEHITRRGIAGRGAFGTVMSATWRAPARPELDVAVKALQPVAPPSGSDPQALHAYKAAVSRWEREPAAAACRAYCALRQELTILTQLRHPHAVPLRGVCAAPLALLLALAPQGSLDGSIREYRARGARLGARAARAALLQLARALEHLHNHRILYRDLKSENVLVWRMPAVEEAPAAERSPAPIDVHVKLGDYGISRLAPPSGTKGFGGTEGFMAPEIMRYNGEEEYNEKVDCFSFGMLMYEVISGRQPFEGHEAIKEAILEGVRPSLSPRDTEYPICMLEIMRRCWSGAPGLRPSGGALVSALAAPECAALLDVASARMSTTHAAVRVQLPDVDAAAWELWYGGGEPERAHSLLAPSVHFTHHHTLRIPPDKEEPVMVTAICRVGCALWIGDSVGRLSVFSASSCELLWTVRIEEVVGGARSPIAALQPLHTLQRVALALSCGRLFLVSACRPHEEGSFVLTELGTATELCCLAARTDHDQVQVWAGGAGLCAYSVRAGGVSAADQLAGGRVTLLAASDLVPAVFAYCDPGVCVYQWSGGQQTARLDCSKLAPCSESLQTIDDGLDEQKCKVTALCCASGLVVVGTAWGCVVVAAARTLRPLAVCRPYEAHVSGIVPLVGKEGTEGQDMVATFGSGYRPLLQRYAPIPLSNSNPSYNGYYCLLWKTHNWYPD